MLMAVLCGMFVGASPAAADAPPATGVLSTLATPIHAKDCLTSGDGYLRARLADAITTNIDWSNAGTRCEGETRAKPPGVRMSFERPTGGKNNLLFVFGITGVREGEPSRAAGVNLTVIVQGTSRIYGTLGDSRCTADSLSQRPLKEARAYRVEARGFCTQPAHAVRGKDALLVSTFEFAGVVVYDALSNEPAPASSKATSK